MENPSFSWWDAEWELTVGVFPLYDMEITFAGPLFPRVSF